MFIHISSVNTTAFKGDSENLKSVMLTRDYTVISSDGGSSAGERPCLTPTHCKERGVGEGRIEAGVEGVAVLMQTTRRPRTGCDSRVVCGKVPSDFTVREVVRRGA